MFQKKCIEKGQLFHEKEFLKIDSNVKQDD